MRPEDAVQAAIVAYLRAVLPGAVVMAIPNAARRTAKGAAGNAVPGLLPGAPDLVAAISGGRSLWIEVKSAKGTVDEQQRTVGMLLQSAGHFWAVVRSIDDVRRALAAWGIKTRERHEQQSA